MAVERAGGKKASAAHRALVGFVGGMSFHVDFEVITAGEGRITFSAMVLLITCVQLHVPIAAALVFEQTTAKGAAERELIAVTLFVTFEETQSAEGLVAELAGVWQARAPFILSKVIVLTVSWRSLILTGGR